MGMIDGMDIETLQKLAELPESEVEWEDLLLRMEIMSRVVRVEMENVAADEVHPILLELVEREKAVQGLLEEAAGIPSNGSENPSADGSPGKSEPAAPGHDGVALSSGIVGTSADADSPSIEAPVDHFVRLRARNFAMLQRRGIEVWKWRVHPIPGSGATVFQLLSFLVARDVESLRLLRGSRTAQPRPC